MAPMTGHLLPREAAILVGDGGACSGLARIGRAGSATPRLGACRTRWTARSSSSRGAPAGSAASCGPGWRGRAGRCGSSTRCRRRTSRTTRRPFVGSVADGDLVRACGRRGRRGGAPGRHTDRGAVGGHPRRQRHRLADRPARGGRGGRSDRRRRVEQPRGRVLGAADRRLAAARRRGPQTGLVLRLEQGGGREPRPAVPRAVRPDRGQPEDRLVLAAPVRPARRGDLALPRRRRDGWSRRRSRRR